jgi:glucose/arabinose dehydrogenase
MKPTRLVLTSCVALATVCGGFAACGDDLPLVDSGAVDAADATVETSVDAPAGGDADAAVDVATDTPVVVDAPKDVATDTPVVVDAPKDVATDTPVVVDAPKDVATDTPATCSPLPKMKLTSVITSGLAAPLYVGSPPGDSSRLFVVEKGGAIKLFKNGSLLSTPFLDITSKVLIPSPAAEGGLLGLAFHPNYATNRKFYIHYTATPSGNVVVAEYTATSGGDTANTTETRIINTAHGGWNHCGGMLAFGKDGYLYAAVGDGAIGGSVLGQSPAPGLDPTSQYFLLGKLLRIDTANLTVPPSGNKSGYVWDWGLRNPWRFSFDRQDGTLYIADVGKVLYEEVNVEPVGTPPRNYGWDTMEGNHCYSATSCNQTGLTLPAVEHGRSEAGSIIGGYVYRGSKLSCMKGRYIYGDYVTNNFFAFTWNGSSATDKLDLSSDLNPGSSITGVASFGEDAAGELYVVSVSTGRVYRIDPE